VRDCLEHLAGLEPRPDEVVLVDASSDDSTRRVADRFPFVQYVHFAGGAGHMTSSRNIGLLHVTGDVLAFVDDDANVRPGWLAGLREAYSDIGVSAVAGRTCNGLPGEESQGVSQIGRLLPNGDLTGNFGADPGDIIDVDHGIGANMSFRRHVLAELGGFRDDFGGVGGVREDSDIFFRLRSLGYRAVFSPNAVVDHVGAPHARGRRFDFRYLFWARHNHELLLSRNFGIGSDVFVSFLRTEFSRILRYSHPNPLRRVWRIAMGVIGVAAGLGTSVRKAGWGPTRPARVDAVGSRIREHLKNVRTS
jgi:GT2 family glycosyltransferase